MSPSSHAYRAGHAARHNARPLDACPYRFFLRKWAWRAGWHDADVEIDSLAGLAGLVP